MIFTKFISKLAKHDTFICVFGSCIMHIISFTKTKMLSYIYHLVHNHGFFSSQGTSYLISVIVLSIRSGSDTNHFDEVCFIALLFRLYQLHRLCMFKYFITKSDKAIFLIYFFNGLGVGGVDLHLTHKLLLLLSYCVCV